jgi:hypothetical protein
MRLRTLRLTIAVAVAAVLALGLAPAVTAESPAAAQPIAPPPAVAEKPPVVAEKAAPAAAAIPPEAAKPPATGMDAADDWIDKTKTPVPWMRWGADLRVRDEYFNAAGLNKESPGTGTKAPETNWQRVRARWWTTVTPVKDMDLNLRFEWEGRHWSSPGEVHPSWAKEQVTIDTANIKLTNVLGTPLTLTLGRQDIILGDGWLVLDGTPFDGSRTIFFDAARGTYNFKEINTTADFIYINQNHRGDALIEPLLDFKQNVIEQDEQGFILWVTNRSIPKTEINGYYIYKAMDSAVAPPRGGDSGYIHTFGARIAGELSDNWKYRAEGATQFGERNGQRLQAFGFNSKLTYLFKDPLNNQLRLAYEFLSGDDPKTTGTNEAWVPLWGRWPQWSELYVITVAATLEQRVAEITNLHRIGMGWTINPLPKMAFAADYHLLFADENTQAGQAGFSQGNSFRGQLLTLLTTYDFTRHLKGHLLAEFFWPGHFYADPKDDMATMLRGELFFTW